MERHRLYLHACMVHFDYQEYICGLCKLGLITENDMKMHFMISHSNATVQFHRKVDTNIATEIENYLDYCEQLGGNMVEVQMEDTEYTTIITEALAIEAASAVEEIDTRTDPSTQQDDDGHAHALLHFPLCVQCEQCSEYVPFRRHTMIQHVHEQHLMFSCTICEEDSAPYRATKLKLTEHLIKNHADAIRKYNGDYESLWEKQQASLDLVLCFPQHFRRKEHFVLHEIRCNSHKCNKAPVVATETNIWQHIVCDHYGERLVKCNECMGLYKNLPDFYRHNKRRHKARKAFATIHEVEHPKFIIHEILKSFPNNLKESRVKPFVELRLNSVKIEVP